MPAATDFAINSSAIGDSYTPFGPSVAILADGRALVVWVVTGGEPDTEYTGFGEAEIRGRWINADGSFAGEDFVVNTTPESFQYRPVATATADGRVFVAWESGDGADGDGTGLRGIVLDPDASAPATDFILNSIRTPIDLPFGPGNQSDVDVIGLSDGRLAAVWTSYDAGDGDGFTVRLRLFDADGGALGEDMVVNSTGVGAQYAPKLIEMADGRLLVSYSSFDYTILGVSPILARVLEADGTPVGDDYVLADGTNIASFRPDMTVLADGRILATWYETGPITFTPGENPTVEPGTIRGRLLDADGQPLGDSFAINTTDVQTNYTGAAAITLPSGGVFVAWYSGDSGDGDWGCLRGRMLDADGTPIGSDMVLNSTSFNLNGNPSLAVGPDGRVLVSWSDEGDMGADAVTRGLWITPMLGDAGNDSMAGTSGDDMMMGLDGADVMAAGRGEDMQMGGAGQDRILGGRGEDVLMGEAGNDRLLGGAGRDSLTGGAGADQFVFAKADLAGQMDVITDMTAQDQIDLSRIDANGHQAGDDAFQFIGSAEFSSAGQLRFAGGVLQGDVDGDGVADLMVRVVGMHTLTLDDLTL